MTSISFELSGLPPGPNVRVNYHWRRRAAVDKQWKADAYLAARAAMDAAWLPYTGWPIRHALVSIVHYLPDKRRRDADNLMAATKVILDGVVMAKLLADDSLDEIGQVTHTFEYRKGKPGLLITVESRE